MLILTLFIVLAAVALPSVHATSALLTRTTSIALIASAIIAFNGVTGLSSSLSIYCDLVTVQPVALSISVIILILGAAAIMPWAPSNLQPTTNTSKPSVKTYPLFVLFTLIGGTSLLVSADLITLYLSIELQSFAVYVMATVLSRDSEQATHSGLLYFLLGGLSSSLVLLGSALIYTSTGQTSIEEVMTLLTVSPGYGTCALGFTLLAVGFLFKITAAPFHHWGPDVYDGIPTIAATWLAVLPKISVLGLLFVLQSGLGGNVLLVSFNSTLFDAWTGLLLVSSFLSLIVGTVVGLAQVRIKRLLAYSTISHVGFLLLALAVHTEEAVSSYLFYLGQYSVTALNVFLVLLALGYTAPNGPKNVSDNDKTYDISFIHELQGAAKTRPVLCVALCVCLFSIAGVPPLAGFYGKLGVLFSAIEAGYVFLALVAIIVSVISASYYLRIVRVVAFDDANITNDSDSSQVSGLITSIHSYTISIFTLMLVFFMISPDLVLDSTRLLALTVYGT